MDVVIEVVAAEATACMTVLRVKTQKVIAKVVTLVSVATTSVLRVLRQGRSSQNAVSPVFTLIEGGLAVA